MRKTTECTIGKRPARVTDLGKVRGDKSWSFFTLMQITFSDTGETLTMPAAQFAKWSTRLDREARKQEAAQNAD